MRFTFQAQVEQQVRARLGRAKREFEKNNIPIEIKYVDIDPTDDQFVFEVHPEEVGKSVAKFLRSMNLPVPYNGCISIEPQGQEQPEEKEKEEPTPIVPPKKIATTRESIRRVIKEVLAEIGESNNPYDIRVIKSNIYTGLYQFEDENKNKYRCHIVYIDDYYSISFEVKTKDDTEYDVDTIVNQGKLFRVMSTVVACIRKYIDSMGDQLDGKIFEFSGTYKENDGRKVSQRTSLYLAFLKKQLPPEYVYQQRSNFVVFWKPVENKTDNNEINEIGEANKKYPFKLIRTDMLDPITPSDVLYRFNDTDGNRYDVYFTLDERLGTGYDILFEFHPKEKIKGQKNDTMQVVNRGFQYFVIGTVVACTKDLMKRYPEATRKYGFSFNGISKPGQQKGEETQRTSLYRAYVNKNLPRGYSVDQSVNYTKINSN